MKMRRRRIRIITAIVMIITMCAEPFGILSSALTSPATEDVIGSYNYTIDNPYKDVDWDTWGAYTGATHVHSHLSDGDKDFDEMIEYYYALGYDCLAMTDHGTVNYGWTKSKSRHSMFSYSYVLHGSVHSLSEQRNYEITTGVGRDGRKMIDVPLGIELNGASAKKVHVNSYFADCGDGDMETGSTWPESAVRKCQNANGVCHINHVGEWTDAKDNIGVYNADFIQRYASLFMNYSSCVGMELVNTADSRTKNDRYLYDQTLMLTAPQGRNIFGFCEDDAHEYSDCGRNAQIFMMPENTVENIRTSMETGAFFACSKNAKMASELGSTTASSNIDYPKVGNISVNDETNQITIACTNAKKVKMVADGNVIESYTVSPEGDSVTFDLNQYEDAINSYVRIFLTGEGGICYVQPFLLTRSENKTPTVQMVLPSDDTNVKVYDSNGQYVEPYSTNGYYKLLPGDYTYTASRQGYISAVNVPFTVTEEEYNNGVQKKVNVVLEADKSISSVYFYVPETIYLNTSDMQSFQYYMDRENTPDGNLNTGLKKTGNVYFNCKGATNVTISYEVAMGVGLSSMEIDTTSSDGDTVTATITGGKMSSALAKSSSSVIKWTAVYYVDGNKFESVTYSYIYAPLAGESSTSAASGRAKTSKTINWLHETMYVTGAAFLAGVHSVSGGTYSYLFAPYGGSSVYACGGEGDCAIAGTGMNTGYQQSDGGSVNVTVTGGTATLYVDTSRINNFSQIPNLTVGLDFLYASKCDESGAVQALSFGSTTLYSISTTANSLGNGQRLYRSDNTNPSTALNIPINTNVTSLNVTGVVSGNKSGRDDVVTCILPLSLNYVDKSVLRDVYNSAIGISIQTDWFTDVTGYDTFRNALLKAGIALGNPAATFDECANAQADLAAALKSLELKQGNWTVNYYLDGEYAYSDNNTYEYGRSVYLSMDSIDGYEFSSWKRYENGDFIESGSESSNRVFGLGTEYVWDVYYDPVSLGVVYETDGDAFIPEDGSIDYVQYGHNLTMPSNVPEKVGYTFNGWLLDNDSKIYAAGESVKWGYLDDAILTAQWTANTYTLTFDLNGGDEASYTGPDTMAIEYQSEFDLPVNPTRNGYQFGGWLLEGREDPYVGGSRTIYDLAKSSVCVAKWIPNQDTTYKVYYFFQNIDNNNYSMDYSKIYSGKGATDSTVTAPLPEFEGFTVNDKVGTISGTISADGTLLLKVFYSRNTYDLNIELYGTDGADTSCIYNGSAIEAGEQFQLKYGASVGDIETVSSNADITFCGWWLKTDGDTMDQFITDTAQFTDDILNTMPGEDITLYAVYADIGDEAAANGIIIKEGAEYNMETGYCMTFDTGLTSAKQLMFVKDSSDITYSGKSEYIGTGTVITVKYGETEVKQITAIIYGDATGDGVVDVFDQSIGTAICNFDDGQEATELVGLALDIDKSMYVDVFDLAVLIQMVNMEI